MAAGLAVVLLGALLLSACVSLPSLEGRSESQAFTDTADTRLGRAIVPQVAARPDKSGIYPLHDSHAAFAARALLAQAAERSLDVQYYIWHKDTAGTLLFEALHAAAERGVRVRLLLDDNNTAGLDETLAALDAHDNIEVRLFNPFAMRSPRWLGYLTDFSRLNRRMHNKSFTADNQVTIVGGRNIGDEYFGADDGMLFVDLDVLAIGPVVQEVSNDFDRYWASRSSYPLATLAPPADSAALSRRAAGATNAEHTAAAATYLAAVRQSQFVRELMSGHLPLEWATARVISDDPAKGLGLAAPEAQLPEKLKQIIGEPAGSLELVSPYFVPTATGTRALSAVSRRGVRLRVLTNSLEATDVQIVHAGYAKRRKDLLEAGVTLYEMRRRSPPTEKKKPLRDGTAPFSSSGSSLHAKTFSVDSRRVFIGSFNFDPRSAHLNTEMGVSIDSPILARRIAELFDSTVRANSYQVQLSEQGDLYWIEQRDGVEIRHDTEPGTGFWQRLGIRFMSLLPIEWLL